MTRQPGYWRMSNRPPGRDWRGCLATALPMLAGFVAGFVLGLAVGGLL